jgi:hypothetical protein
MEGILAQKYIICKKIISYPKNFMAYKTIADWAPWIGNQMTLIQLCPIMMNQRRSKSTRSCHLGLNNQPIQVIERKDIEFFGIRPGRRETGR